MPGEDPDRSAVSKYAQGLALSIGHISRLWQQKAFSESVDDRAARNSGGPTARTRVCLAACGAWEFGSAPSLMRAESAASFVRSCTALALAAANTNRRDRPEQILQRARDFNRRTSRLPTGSRQSQQRASVGKSQSFRKAVFLR